MEWFLERTVKTGAADDVTTVIGAAQREEDVLRAVAKLSADDPTATYRARPDRRSTQEIYMASMSEDSWNTAVSTGLSSQRVRGKQLQNFGADPNLEGHQILMDPLEATAIQINQISRRTVMRNYYIRKISK